MAIVNARLAVGMHFVLTEMNSTLPQLPEEAVAEWAKSVSDKIKTKGIKLPPEFEAFFKKVTDPEGEAKPASELIRAWPEAKRRHNMWSLNMAPQHGAKQIVLLSKSAVN